MPKALACGGTSWGEHREDNVEDAMLLQAECGKAGTWLSTVGSSLKGKAIFSTGKVVRCALKSWGEPGWNA